MQKYISLAVSFCLVIGSLSLALPRSVQASFSYGVPIKPAQDVSVYSNGYFINAMTIGNETQNYHKAASEGGEKDVMRVGLDFDNTSAQTYLKYDLSSLPAHHLYSEASIQLKPISATEGTQVSIYGLHPLQKAADWSEEGMTWRSRFLHLTDSIDTIQIVNSEQTIRFNVTEYVKSRQRAGAAVAQFVIKAETPGSMELRGRETTEADKDAAIPSLIVNENPSDLPVAQPYTPKVQFEYEKNMLPLHDGIVYNPATTGNKDADRNYHSTNTAATIADGMTLEFNKSYSYFKFDISDLPEPERIGPTLFGVWGRDTSRATTATAATYAQIYVSSDHHWTETDITWNNKPALDPVPIAEFLIKTSNNYQGADITDYVKQQRRNGAQYLTLAILVKDNSGNLFHRGKDTTAGGQLPPRLIISDPTQIPEGELKLGEDGRSRLYPADWYPGYQDEKGRFLHDFSYAGYHRGEKPIPVVSLSQSIDVTQSPYLADSSGVADATEAIQRAIDDASARGGGVVYMPEGTYKVSVQPGKDYSLTIPSGNIVLKGAGMNKTHLYNATENMKGKDIIRVGNGDWKRTETIAKLAKDEKESTALITVSDASQFHVNDYVIISFDTTQEFLVELGMQQKWASRIGRVEPLFYRQIVAVDRARNMLTLDIPTRYPLKQRDHVTITKTEKPVEEVGIEGFSIANVQNPNSGLGENDFNVVGTAGYESDNAKAINVVGVANSWIRNLNTYKPAGNETYHILSKGIILDRTKNMTVDNVTMEYPQYRGANGNGYLFQFIGNDNLISNSKAVAARHSYTYANVSANGNVLYNSVSEDPTLLTDFHMYLSMANLIDNMTMRGDAISAITRDYGSSETNRHGVVTTESVFWSTYGERAHSSKSGIVIESEQFGYGYSIGTSGPVSGVRVNINGSIPEADTRPYDYVEGVGEGGRMNPQSLYVDQLNRRLSGGHLGLRSLLVNGIAVHGMQPLKTEYHYVMPFGSTQAPVIEAEPADPGAVVRVTQPSGLNGMGMIEVSKSGESKQYIIQFAVEAQAAVPVQLTLAPDKTAGGWRAAGNSITAGHSGKLKLLATLSNGDTLLLGGAEHPVSFTVFNQEAAMVEGNIFKALKPGVLKLTVSFTYNGKTVSDTQIFEVKEPISEPEGPLVPIAKATASANDGNLPENTIDRDPDSRWSADGKNQFLLLELEKEALIDEASILFYNGHQRSSYFDLQVSTDGVSYTTVLSDAQSAKPDPNTFETFSFTPVKAKFVKYVGYGNELNGWNSILEIWIHGQVESDNPDQDSEDDSDSDSAPSTPSGSSPLPDGNTESRFLLDNEWIDRALDSIHSQEQQSPLQITVELPEQEDMGELVIPAQSLISAGTKAPGAVLNIHYRSIVYHLPLKLLQQSLAEVMEGEQGDARIVITIDKLAGEMADRLKAATEDQGAKLLSEGFDFQVTAETNYQRVSMNDFGTSYVSRTFTLSVEVDSDRASAVSYNPETGKLYFVPATFTMKDGKTEVTIYRTGNSIYTVVKAEKSFADVKGHWAQQSIEHLASKLLVEGTEVGFLPDQAVTRAEFSALLTRALGLVPKSTQAFEDVSEKSWYADAVGAAHAAGLVNGYENGRFMPNAPITREEMAVMISRSLHFLGESAEIDEAKLLSFTDNAAISLYAREAVAAALQAQFMSGRQDTVFAPKENATRAEATVMLERLLKKAFGNNQQ
jgi:hypothetical protein